MNLAREDYTRIAAYFSGQMTEEERKSFAEWRATLTDQAVINEFESIWQNSGVRATAPVVDTDHEWTELQKIIRRFDEEKTVANSSMSMWLRIAAALLIVTLVGVWLFPTNQDIPPIHSFTAEKSVETFYLPDSSRIWLNAGSSLSYEEGFGQTERRVRLRGEGYFNVSVDKARPFIIQTDNALVRVVGTSFNLREDIGHVSLEVEEGLVRFSLQDSVRISPILVTAGETALAKKNADVTKTKTTGPPSSRWRLKNNPLYEDEKSRPAAFLNPQFEWRKNTINQSVIRGKLVSTSELAIYKNIVLLVRYRNAKGRVIENEVQIPGIVRPGDSVGFEKRLFDIFRDTRAMKISVKSAEVAEQ
jgi:transmembrane sensor